MTTDAVGGVWQYSIDVAAGLAHHGAQVLLAILGPRPSEQQRRRVLEIPDLTVVQGDFALEWMADPWSDVDAAGKWLLDLQSRFGADIIHLNEYTHAARDWLKPVLVVGHSCVYSWWHAVHGSAPGPEWDEYHRRVRAGLAAAHAIVAPSAYMAASLQQQYGVSSEKLHVIHNFSRGPRSSGRVKRPFILAAGRLWDQAKNITLLNNIAPSVDWEIKVAGSDRGTETVPLPAENIRLLGDLPHAELMRQMDLASIFAHPARYEPFGLAVLEAARARCCLVLAAIPSLKELWDGTAVFLDPQDCPSWTRELNALARDPLRRQELGRLAHSRASRFRAATSLRKYWSLYRSLIESAPRAGSGVAA